MHLCTRLNCTWLNENFQLLCPICFTKFMLNNCIVDKFRKNFPIMLIHLIKIGTPMILTKPSLLSLSFFHLPSTTSVAFANLRPLTVPPQPTTDSPPKVER